MLVHSSHIPYENKLHSYHNENSEFQTGFLNVIDIFTTCSVPRIKKTVKQGICCTLDSVPLAMLYLPHMSSYLVLLEAITKYLLF
jgi:hypothetical protein